EGMSAEPTGGCQTPLLQLDASESCRLPPHRCTSQHVGSPSGYPTYATLFRMPLVRTERAGEASVRRDLALRGTPSTTARRAAIPWAGRPLPCGLSTTPRLGGAETVMHRAPPPRRAVRQSGPP